MVNLYIKGHSGICTKIGNGQKEAQYIVTFLSLDQILFEDHVGNRMNLTIDELREIVQRWDAGV